MSRTPGPTGWYGLADASRTPGTLGVNDAASPSRSSSQIGDTPGTLGVNDHAAARAGRRPAALRRPVAERNRWAKFLNSSCDWNTVSVPGPQLAWNSTGHWDMTRDVVSDVSSDRDFLPPRTSIVRYKLEVLLQSLPANVVLTDITIEQYSDTPLGHVLLPQTGQATHFMANQGQPQLKAYQAGIKKIFGPVNDAIESFTRTLYWVQDSDLMKTSQSLADGVHALQDSFSPVHVKREQRGEKWIIQKLYVWGEENKKDHEAGDETWRNKDGSLSGLGRAVEDATRMLLTYFVLTVVGKKTAADKSFNELMDKYFEPGQGILLP